MGASPLGLESVPLEFILFVCDFFFRGNRFILDLVVSEHRDPKSLRQKSSKTFGNMCENSFYFFVLLD